ncbi:MAG: hypothetical protein U9N12_02845 [Euryarchaeota archaeon]|nr:hypothetical protein [Euryarchaeota archaeon]
MIPSNIDHEHVIKAIREIDSNGIPSGRGSIKFLIEFEGKQYPPKYAISLANKFANGEELDSSKFNGGQETNNFLKGLGFDIVEAPPSRDPIVSPPNGYSDGVVQTERHNERCPDCKATVKRMLEKIYGDVKLNHKFYIGTNPENFRDTLHYEALKRIFTNLQNYRGHKNFVYAVTLPNCDYFVPDPGFVVEFDESQHFTIPRKIALLSYPYNSKSGFSLGQWAFTCDKTRAKDNDPYYRDEQRAWYDTLRDFLPELQGNLEPTVRLYSKEMRWCSLDPDNPTDVARFKSVIDRRKKDLNGWVATVTLRSDKDKDYSNNGRMRALSEIVDRISRKTHGDGVILFPGGWFYTDKDKPSTIYDWAEKQIGAILEKVEENIIVCAGIDGAVDKEEYSQGQIGIAVSKNGIDARGRKFHPSSQERGHVDLAPDYLSKECGKSRIFELNGVKYFMCVCYDTYGIRHKNLPNPDVDVVLNLVHCFYLPGEGPSGASYFARHGFAGASKEWGCPVFGTAVFFNRDILENWPTGVYWNIGDKSTQHWSYSDNPVKYGDKFEICTNEDITQVRIYDLATI